MMRLAAGICLIFLLSVAFAPLLTSHDSERQDRQAILAPPDAGHPLGTDEYGRDRWARFLYGGRVSLLAGALATLLATGLGLLIGGLAGYAGGWLDGLLMRIADFLLALPWLYLLLILRAFLPLSLGPAGAFLLVAGVVGLLGWARPARMVRAAVMEGKEREYVAAARMLGVGHGSILLRHLLPLAVPAIVTQAALLLPRFILAEVSLSFLGLGVGEPTASWGNLLAPLRQITILSGYPWMAWPALLLGGLFFCLSQVARDLENQFNNQEVTGPMRYSRRS